MAVTKSTPRFYTDGIQDNSTTTGASVEDVIPQHLPRFFLYAPKGPETDTLVTSSTVMDTIFGDETLTEGSDYFNHQSVFAYECTANANAMFVHRIVPDDATKANLGLFAEIVEADFSEYVRDDDGNVEYDVNGDAETDSDTTVTGMSIRWSVRVLTDDELGGQASTSTGTLTGADDAEATVYPIMEFPAYHYGTYGTNIGWRMWVPVSTSSNPADSTVIENSLTLLYRFQFVSRDDSTSTATTWQTQSSEQYVDISFKDNVTNVNTDKTYEVEKLNTEYSSFTAGYTPVYGPIDTPYVYSDNLETILEKALTYENDYEADSIDDKYLMNIFTGIAWDGTEHETVRTTSDSLEFTSSSTHYLLGGDDGTMSDDDFDDSVATELTDGWYTEGNAVADKLHYPFSCMYDSGFTLATKKLFYEALGYRPDIHVATCTQVDGADQNSISDDSSAGQSLLNSAKLTPESEVYGTDVVRAVICRSTGEWEDSTKGRIVPLLLDLLVKRCKYMGASAGSMKHVYAYDQWPAKQVEALKAETITGTYAKDSVKDTLWSYGLNGVEYLGRSVIGWTAVQTVYSDSTSVLCSDINMMILVDIIKKANKTWAETENDNRSTDAQYLQKIEDTFNKKVEGIYDGRVTIEASAYQTDDDELNGYSSTIDVNVYANNQRTVQQWNIIANRASALDSSD